MRHGELGMIVTPAQGNAHVDCVWAGDNGCFGKGYPGDEGYLEFLESRVQYVDRCLFAVAPDVVADAAATLARSAPFLPLIRAMGYPAAFVAQDGLESLPVPWDSFDVLFIGGSTAWKLGPHAAALIAEAKRRGKGTHIGRVNSERRYRRFATLGADSCDGTYIAFGPDQNLPDVLAWQRGHRDQPALFGGVA